MPDQPETLVDETPAEKKSRRGGGRQIDDPECIAIFDCIQAVSDLDAEAKHRVIWILSERFKKPTTQA